MSSGSTKGDPLTVEVPSETILAVEIENRRPCLLFSQLVQDTQVLEHDEVISYQDVPPLEFDHELDLVLQESTDGPVISDPNLPLTDHHILLPLAHRASMYEQSEMDETQSTWLSDMEAAELEAIDLKSTILQPHRLTMKLDHMGTLQPQTLVPKTHNVAMSSQVQEPVPSRIIHCPIEDTVIDLNGTSVQMNINSDSTASDSVATRSHPMSTFFPILVLLQYNSTIWLSELATTEFSMPSIHHASLVYYTLQTLANFVDVQSPVWQQLRGWITNSTVPELLSRLILFGSDIFTLNIIKAECPERAHIIARSKATLTTLIGNNVSIIPDDALDSTLMLNQLTEMVPRWRMVSKSFQGLNRGLKEYKYIQHPDDPNYRSGPNPVDAIIQAKEVLEFNSFRLVQTYMPMPALAFLVPLFRSLPQKFVIMANQVCVVVDLTSPEILEMVIEANEDLFVKLLLTSKALQLFGIYNELLAQTNNLTWSTRSQIQPSKWSESFTWYDADYVPISIGNKKSRPVPKYYSSPGGNNAAIENLVWLISSNRDQSILMLHQYQQGSHMGACPYMSNFVATTTSCTWSHDTLLQNVTCRFCNNHRLNPWYSCNRRASMVNCHPGLLCIRRQHYYMVKIFCKFAIPDKWVPITYQGHPGATTAIHTYRIPHITLPLDKQVKTYIAHGNETGVDVDGFGLGTCLILNTGCMSHGSLGSSTNGLSKSLSMALTLLICPLEEDKSMDFSNAWYAADVTKMSTLNRELLRLLNLAVTKYFWTFEVVDGTVTLATDWPFQPTYMSGCIGNLELELLICWDSIAHAIQKVLNVNNIVDQYNSRGPQLGTVEFDRDTVTRISANEIGEDGMPNMARQPTFVKKVLYKYDSSDEENYYKLLREQFKSRFQIRFSHLHPCCLWDKSIMRLIYTIWELCQSYSCCMVYTGAFHETRTHLLLTDFRLNSSTLLHMVTKYMEFVSTPFPGYRVRSQYARWISRNPEDGGRIFQDDNGRRPQNVLSALYLGHGDPNYYYAEDHCKATEKYPGCNNLTTFHQNENY